MKSKALLFAATLSLTSCNYIPDWLGESEEAALPGERYSVMSLGNKLSVDSSVKFDQVTLPAQSKEITNRNGNHYLKGDLITTLTADAGESADDYLFITASPTGSNDMIIALDGEQVLRGFDLNLQQIWEKEIESPEDEEVLPGGGLTVKDGILYVTTGFGAVIAANVIDGSEIWRKSLSMPVHNAPTVFGNKLFVITNNNQLFALDAETGDSLWRHSGVSETTKIFGTPAPAVKNSLLIAAYSSGEIFGINTEQGRELWTELLSLSSDRTKASAAINDITASPVIVDGIAYITSFSGNLSAFNISNGFRIWEQPIAASTTPWSSGKYLFVTSTDGKLIAMNRFDGRIKWISELPIIDEDESPFFSGPVVAGDHILIASSEGYLFKIDPADGLVVQKTEIPEDVYAPITVYNGYVYLISNDAEIIRVN